MIVDQRQRTAALPVHQPYPALEVHLPQQVGRVLLESQRAPAPRPPPAPSACGAPGSRAPSTGRRRHRPSRASTAAILRAPQAGCADRAPPRSAPRAQHHLRRGCACGRRERSVSSALARGPARQPLVPGVRVDPEPSAQLPPVRPFLAAPDAQTPRRASIFDTSATAWTKPPASLVHSIRMCRSSPRTPVGYLSRLNSLSRPSPASHALSSIDIPGTGPGMTVNVAVYGEPLRSWLRSPGRESSSRCRTTSSAGQRGGHRAGS